MPARCIKNEGHTLAIGFLDAVIRGRIEGWLFAEAPLTRPYVTVDGRPARILKTDAPRPDVERALGIKGDYGFVAELPGSCHGRVQISLFAVDGDRVRPVHEHAFDVCYNDGFSSLDLAEAVAISRDPRSVAIVVWDAAHNPVGRAKVLYDVVSDSRPAVLFGFCHSEFGTTLWEPLQSSPIRCCLVRPEQFSRFRDAAREIGLGFDTIWLCKPRLPTFQLAEAIARPGCAMILDIDDNEEAFSRGSHSWCRGYGETSMAKAALYRDSITVRSVASISLQERFGGEIVRHVRRPRVVTTDRVSVGGDKAATDADKPDLRLIFIGTVRPHKGLLEAARAIRMAAYKHKLSITLTVGGTFDPPALKKELADAGVEVMGLIRSEELPETLARYDAVLTGHPGNSTFDEINTYQISSKIGDALQAGLPVLVPWSPATADLAETAGIYLFTAATFDDAIYRLANKSSPAPHLPHSFTISAASETFKGLEEKARAASVTWTGRASATARSKSKVVLLWKQNDANLFGRRVDQIARLLVSELKDTRVHIVEFATPKLLDIHNNEFCSSDFLCNSETRRKVNGVVRDGIHHHTIVGHSARGDGDLEDLTYPGFRRAFEGFLADHAIYPTNSLLINFPLHYIHSVSDDILPALQPFELVVDVVDNQLSWGKTEQRPTKIASYRALCDLARMVVFNSELNRAMMEEMAVVEHAKTVLIPNWYIPPKEDLAPSAVPSVLDVNGPTVLYSGDLNNRMDWTLLADTVDLLGSLGGVLHLVGGAQRVQQEIVRLLSRRNCIYHGAMREEDVLAIAATCDFAVVPHVHDDLSAYMNPLKIKMYAAIGLPHVVTDVPGIDSSSELTVVARNHHDFLATVRAFCMPDRKPRAPSTTLSALPQEASDYCRIVEQCLEAVRGKAEKHRPAFAAA